MYLWERQKSREKTIAQSEDPNTTVDTPVLYVKTQEFLVIH